MPATETLTLRVPPDLAAKVRAGASAAGESVNAFGTEALRRHADRTPTKSTRKVKK